ncbi:protein of unknown function [Limnospira indica PCC 8005]|uniref:Uncharacterized protein n=1 Tax=Limnospira indica PCC 8005 TaxID=376219 RepID=A0A9P1P050_9CYAN|nr:protein of unknown function [Limnospira indica PCC 8005]
MGDFLTLKINWKKKEGTKKIPYRFIFPLNIKEKPWKEDFIFVQGKNF